MGLDMYLTKKKYIGNKYRDGDKQVKVIVPENQEGVTFPTATINNAKISTIIEETGYWRKANHIHNWFVENIQDETDNCEEHFVNKDKLKELLNTCKKVEESLKDSPTTKATIKTGWDKNGETFADIDVFVNTETAKRLLPTQEGFFFGSTDYDEDYLEDIKNTIIIIETALKDEKGEYYYSASW